MSHGLLFLFCPLCIVYRIALGPAPPAFGLYIFTIASRRFVTSLSFQSPLPPPVLFLYIYNILFRFGLASHSAFRIPHSFPEYISCVHVCVRLSCLFVRLSVCLSISYLSLQTIYLPIYLSVCLYIFISFILFFFFPPLPLPLALPLPFLVF